jgi:signal transduction histidine kinase
MSVASEPDQGSTFTVTLPINWKANAGERRA